MKPKTPLPWKEIPCYYDNQCEAFEPKDADFMLHASNSYPECVEFIRYALRASDIKVSALRLLRELGESPESPRIE